MKISSNQNYYDIYSDNNIVLRRIKNVESDYRLLEKWYLDEKIYSQFEQHILNYDEVVNKYLERTLDNTSVPTYIIEYNGISIGLIQYKLISNEDKKLYCVDKNIVYELDIFIGESMYRGKGLGGICVDLLTKHLFNFKDADAIVMCPLVDNENAILCYKKVGFDIIRKFSAKDTVGNIKMYYLMLKK